MKKGQITLFMIIGIVMLVLFGIYYVVYSSKSSATSRPALNKVTETHLDTTAVNSYIKDCLDSTAREAIQLVGYQGGYIYDYQVNGGMPFDPLFSVEYYSNRTNKTYNQTLALFDEENNNYAENARKGSLVYPPDLAQYPYGLQNAKVPTFANIPTLCEGNGTNYNIPGSKSCETYDSYFSVQSVLRKYIEKKVVGCFDFSHFYNEKGLNITHVQPNVSVYLGEESVNVIMDMQLNISQVDKECRGDNCEVFSSSRNKFAVDVPVRLKEIHELAWHVLERDASDIFFNLKNPHNLSLNDCLIYNGTEDSRNTTGPCVKPGMKVIYLYNESSDYRTIIIEDNKSKIISQYPYQFVMTIKNRKPHLAKISYKDYGEEYKNYLQSVYGFSPEEIYNQSRYPPSLDPTHTRDVVVDAGKDLIIIPYAIDPDEDYSRGDITFMEKIYSYQSSTLPNLNSHIYHFPGTPNLHKDIKYTTTNADIGHYTIKVSVTDPRGKTAERIIKVWIRCSDSHPEDYKPHISLDDNVSNDCCNEQTGELYKDNTYKCGDCMRCNSSGDCSFNNSFQMADCGPCRTCSVATSGCIINDAFGNAHGHCTGPGETCCAGKCQTERILNSLNFGTDWNGCSILYWHKWSLGKNAGCWTTNPVCIPQNFDPNGYYTCLRGLYIKEPILGPNAIPANTAICDNGKKCTDGICTP